jgi:hypothetical protein
MGAITETFTVLGAKPVALALICVLPTASALTWGGVAGRVAPAGMTTLVVTVAADGLLLVKLIVNPPAGAAVPRLSGRFTVWPTVTLGIVLRLISDAVAVTAVVPVTYPGALALNVAGPFATPLKVKEPVVSPCATLTVAGEMVTNPVLELDRVTTTPPEGAAWLSVKLPDCEDPTPTKELVTDSVMGSPVILNGLLLADVRPVLDAVKV